MTRRLLPVIAVLCLLAVPVSAAADDALEEMLQQAGEADFEGRGIVLSTWGGDSAAATYEISRHEGMAMVKGAGVDLMLGSGIMATRSGTEWYGLEIDAWSEWDLSDRYSLSPPEPVRRLGRSARQMQVIESDVTRARIVVDDESGVPLQAEIYDAEGRLFRMAVLVDFDSWQADATPMPTADVMERSEMRPAASAGRLPATAAWYLRADVYAGPGETIHAFYTDGLFSFSVFESDRAAAPDAFRTATSFTVDGEAYRRIVTPSQVWVYWNAPDETYVLVGDLPPDHLEAVLPDLPEPGNRAFLVRLWRRLFG